MKQCTQRRVKKGRSWDYSYFLGIVMVLEAGGNGRDDGMPLRARKEKYGGLDSEAGCNYKNTWITGDYDLQDLMYHANGCERPDEKEASFAAIKLELNQGMTWDGIQHGPHAQWVPKKTDAPGIITDQVTEWVGGPNPDPPTMKVESRELPVCDNKLTVVYPGGSVYLKENQDVKDALICMGCSNPKPKRK